MKNISEELNLCCEAISCLSVGIDSEPLDKNSRIEEALELLLKLEDLLYKTQSTKNNPKPEDESPKTKRLKQMIKAKCLEGLKEGDSKEFLSSRIEILLPASMTKEEDD